MATEATSPAMSAERPGENGMAHFANADGSKVDREHVEGGLGRAVEHGREIANVAVGVVAVDILDHQGTGTRA